MDSKQHDKEILISTKGLFKNFPVGNRVIRVLKGLDLEIQKGELFMVVGPSGSGKSTLMHTLMGLERPTYGRILFKGRDLSRMKQDELIDLRRNEIGIVYQQSNWIRALKVAENVAFPLLLKGVDKHTAHAKAVEMLKLVDLDEWADFYANELSSGQQQRVAVARAMITNPEVIIADEPTGNLDYATGINLMRLLSKLVKEEGKTVIMVTHDLSNIEYADRVINFFDGKVQKIIQPTADTVGKIKRQLLEVKPQVQDHASENEEIALAMGKGQENLRWNWQYIKYRLRSGVVRNSLLGALDTVQQVFRSFLIVLTSIFYRLVYFLLSIKPISTLSFPLRNLLEAGYDWLCNRLELDHDSTIGHNYLLDIALRNLTLRKSRTVVTIGGVAVGIGFTVFLISLGFGLERIVIDGIANLNQLKQVEVYGPASSALKLSDETLSDFNGLTYVEGVYPVTGIAGRVSYQEGNSDIVVYGVQGDFLANTDTILTNGELFTNNNLTISNTATLPAETTPKTETETSEQLVVTEDGEEYIAVSISDYSSGQLVVNDAFLDLLDIDAETAVGTTVSLSLVATEEVIDESIELQSIPEPYEILGVISNFDIPTAYVPITDTKALGIQYYSQFRVITPSEDRVPFVRSQIETLGYRTTSILDTINQIEALFDTVRGIFALVGLIALAVASFGMFNTLTVSLLERTREVGLMKAMGMGTKQVRDLFLTESITMGLLGGVLGILLGIVSGLLISLLLSLIAINRGFEFINITYLPFVTAAGITLLAGMTGLITGFYPATRATRISALDALRYE